jgi:hypothetical protein
MSKVKPLGIVKIQKQFAGVELFYIQKESKLLFHSQFAFQKKYLFFEIKSLLFVQKEAITFGS